MEGSDVGVREVVDSRLKSSKNTEKKRKKSRRPKKRGRPRKKKLGRYIILNHKRVLRTTYDKLFKNPDRETRLSSYHKVLYAYHFYRYCRVNSIYRNSKKKVINEKDFYKLFNRAVELMTESLCNYQFITLPYIGEIQIAEQPRISKYGRYNMLINYPKTIERYKKTNEIKIIYVPKRTDYKIIFTGKTRLYNKLKFKPSNVLRESLEKFFEDKKNEINI